MFPCNSDKELRSEEENVIKYLNPNLNTYSAFQSVEEKKEYHKEYKKKYYKLNKEIEKERYAKYCSVKITCECGCETNQNNISRHRKSQKHLNLMELKKDL